VGTISPAISFLNKLINQRYVFKTYVAIVKVKIFLFFFRKPALAG